MALLDQFIRDKDGTAPTTIKIGTYQSFKTGERVRYDGTKPAFTITLLKDPNDGDVCAVQEVAGGSSTITVDANGRFVGDPGAANVPASSYTSDTPYATTYFQFSSDVDAWLVTASGTVGSGGGGSDAAAIHDNVSGEIAAISAGTVASGDLLLIEDVDDSDNKKKVTAQAVADLGGGGTDADAIHDNVAGEIAAIAAATVASGDLLVIEDIDDSNDKKKVTAQAIADLGGGGGGGSGLTMIAQTAAGFTATIGERQLFTPAAGGLTVSGPASGMTIGQDFAVNVNGDFVTEWTMAKGNQAASIQNPATMLFVSSFTIDAGAVDLHYAFDGAKLVLV